MKILGYGFFTGGDPRLFRPDTELCTASELQQHKEDCEAWNKGERPVRCYGIGTYEMEDFEDEE